MKKNDMTEVTIEDIGVNGEGIGKVNGYTLFIKDAIIGDRVKVKVIKAKKNYGYGKLMEVVEPSEFRVPAVCPVAKQCGGCQIQELAYDKQLEFKEQKVLGNLERIGGLDRGYLEEIREPIIGMENPFRYRNKALFPIGKDKDGHAIAGFYAGRTHSIVDNRDCLLGVRENRLILECLLGFIDEFGVSVYEEGNHVGLMRYVLIRSGFHTGEIMVCLVVNGFDIPHGDVLVERLIGVDNKIESITLSVNREKGNVVMGKDVRLLYGRDYITDYIGEIKYRISPLSFYQVNPVQTKVLYEQALEYAGLNEDEVVWDLYCGIGTISLFLAQKAKKVYGVEIVPEAIADARVNAEINGIGNVEFLVGKAEVVLPEMYREKQVRADVIVVDPPRKGCDEAVLETMVEMGPGRIVYVSCDSATLGRDLKYLRGMGYEVERVRAVDMFGMTVHVETVVLLTRKAQ
ncbi:MAG: 23S rRNA (uracil(1939)-C(5))-methyltransferase RlmD [Lachnospiraceae bacterium]